MAPILQDLEGAIQDRRAVGGHLKLIDGLIEAGVGVEIGAEPHADGLDVIHQLLLGEMASAVERHMLHEMGQTPLVSCLPGSNRR